MSLMSRANRSLKRALTMDPYVTTSIALLTVGFALPLAKYLQDGKQMDAERVFDLRREMQRNPMLEQRGVLAFGSQSASEQERMRKYSHEQYKRERRAAARGEF